jgi:hypothetical protein
MTAVKEFLGRRKVFSRFLVILIMLGIYFIVVFLFLNYPPVYTHQPDTVPEGCISSDQAYSIAIPYIKEYAQETNRVIVRIDVSFSNDYPDADGLRGEPFLRYPMWEVSAYFPTLEEYGVFGYSVFIWADTGQLFNKGAQGIM